MKYLILILVLIIAVLGGILLVQDDPGFVLIRYAGTEVTTSLAFTLAAVVALAVVMNLVFRLVMMLLRLPRSIKQGNTQRKVLRGRRLLVQGLIDLAEGRFENAERNLLKLVEFSDSTLINYLAAARAAQLQGHNKRRDEYLKLAHEHNPQAGVAIGVTQAELQLSSKQTERALATLNSLNQMAPKHDYVQRLLARVYLQLQDWALLSDLLPEIRRKKLFPEDRLKDIETQAYSGQLRLKARAGLKELEQSWTQLPKECRADTEYVLIYAQLLLDAGANEAAEKIVRETLGKQWSDRLAELYGRIPCENPNQQMQQAELWLKDNDKNPYLLLTLGRLSLRVQLWGKARSFMEASLGQKALPESCLELAQLLSTQMGEVELAHQYYRQGLELCLQDTKKPHTPSPVAIEALASSEYSKES